MYEKRINDEIDKSGIHQVEMEGMYKNLFRIGKYIENTLQITYGLGHALDDAPYMGWQGERLKDMRRVQEEIESKTIKLYAIVLARTGRKIGENGELYYVDRYAWHLDKESGQMYKITKQELGERG